MKTFLVEANGENMYVTANNKVEVLEKISPLNHGDVDLTESDYKITEYYSFD